MEQAQAGPEYPVATGNDSVEENPYLARKHLGWCGRFEADEWYCKCGRKAKSLPTTKKGRNLGRWFYMCPVREPKQEGDPEQCRFFLWFDEEDAAKEYMKSNPTTPTKQTLKLRETRTPNYGSSKALKDWLTPGKKRASKDISDEDTQEDEDKDDEEELEFVLIENDDDETFSSQDNTRDGSPPRKAAKVTRFATPGQPSNKMLDACRNALPTPATSGRDVEVFHEARQLQVRDASPTPVQLNAAIVLGDAEPENSQGSNDLMKRILDLIKADHPDLKASTEIMIEHEIEQEVRRNQAEAKGYRKTIAKLRIKVDELETTVSLFFKGNGADDVVELSD